MPHGHHHSHSRHHGHDGCGHGPAPGAKDDISRRFIVGAALNCIFVVAELTAGLMAKSMALIADALHNFSDVAGLLLAWGGLWLMRRSATPRRTYGYRSASYLAALANAGLLLLATGAMMLEAVQRLFAPAEVASGPVMLVAGVAILVNMATAMLFWRGQKSDINLRAAYLHMLADAALSLGVVLSAALMAWTGRAWIDPAASLVIASFIIWATLRLAREALDMALAAVPSHIEPEAVAQYLRGLPEVEGIHDLHIWPISTDETALTVHLVAPKLSGDDAFLQRVCGELRGRFAIGHATIQLEKASLHADCQLNGHAHD